MWQALKLLPPRGLLLNGQEKNSDYQSEEDKMSKYGDQTHNWFESVINKLGGLDRANAFLRGELVIKENQSVGITEEVDCTALRRHLDASSGPLTLADIKKCLKPKWREEEGVIYFTVTSDGTTGERWIARLEGLGFQLSDLTKSVLRSPDFKPTTGVNYNIAVLKGELFTDEDRITKKIRSEALKRKLSKPAAEVGCLIRVMFTDDELKAMGLWWIVAMHEPINDSDGGPVLLGVGRVDVGQWLDAFYGRPGGRWAREDGFAFVASQVSPQK